MGFSPENWLVAGIQLRGPLKPIYTGGGAAESGEEATTPTAEGSKIPPKLPCPPPPKKRRAAGNNGSRCKYSNGKKEFFVTPDLETVFIRRHVGC